MQGILKVCTINNLVITIIRTNQREKEKPSVSRKDLFRCLFEELKSAFNIQKVHLKKKYIFIWYKKLKVLLRVQNA
jgi:hypothetical protein